MAETLNIALVGLGTVGAGVIKLLDANHDLIARRAGRPIRVTAISARDRTRDRGVDLSRFDWVDDVSDIAARGDVDIVVELIGGADGVALALAEQTFAAGKPFVTANKAMIAHHGMALATAAQKSGQPLKYEAAVAGGIPLIKGLREGAAANRLERVYGILNGTCNYILSRMEDEGSDFADVLADAQALGFAEADPSFDVDGIDTAHKLAILASLAFGTEIAFDQVAVGGIRTVTAADIAQARTLGFCIRLIGMADEMAVGDERRLFQRVHPCLVPLDHPLAAVKGPTNAVVAEGNFVGRLLFEGRGAGEGPTASAVVADLIDIARGDVGPAFAIPVSQLTPAVAADAGSRVERAYLRFNVNDRPGVLAEITAAMRDAGVSIASMIQRGETQDGGVFVAMTTHEAPASAVNRAMDALRNSASMVGAPVWMPILDL